MVVVVVVVVVVVAAVAVRQAGAGRRGGGGGGGGGGDQSSKLQAPSQKRLCKTLLKGSNSRTIEKYGSILFIGLQVGALFPPTQQFLYFTSLGACVLPR